MSCFYPLRKSKDLIEDSQFELKSILNNKDALNQDIVLSSKKKH